LSLSTLASKAFSAAGDAARRGGTGKVKKLGPARRGSPRELTARRPSRGAITEKTRTFFRKRRSDEATRLFGRFLPENEQAQSATPRVPPLINRLKELKMQRNMLAMQKQFEKVDLMILDELGYISFDREGGELLFTHLSMRTERKSTIVTTNLSFDKWKTIFNDPVLTTAIVDRITHNSYVLNMIGETRRHKLD
jgi:hypothetical protein